MKKLKFYPIIISLFSVILFSACKNFFGGSSIADEITKAIEYENAQKVEVKLEADPGVGRLSDSGKIECRVGYKTEISFIPSEDYIFLGWKCYNSDDGKTELTDCVSFDDVCAEKTSFTVSRNEKILIKPNCTPVLKPIDFSPVKTTDGVAKNENISIKFNHNLDISEEELDQIHVTAGNSIVTDKFIPSIINGNEIQLTASPTDFIDLASGTQIVNVSIPKDLYYKAHDENGREVKLQMTQNYDYSYFINHTTKQTVDFNYAVEDTNFGKLNVALGGRKYNLGDSIELKFIAKDGYKLYGWKITSPGATLDEIKKYISIKEPDPETAALLAESNTYQLDLKIIQHTNLTITAEPLVFKKIGIEDSSTPKSERNGVARTSAVRLDLTHPLAGEYDLSKIKILLDGKETDEDNNNVASTYFTLPELDDTKQFITINTSDNLIPIGSNGTREITIIIPDDFSYQVPEASVAPTKFESELKYSYIVNASTVDKLYVSIKANENYGTLKIDGSLVNEINKTYNIEEEAIIVFQLKTGYKFNGWNIPLTHFRVSAPKDLDGYTPVSGRNYSYNASTDSYAARIKVLKAGTAEISVNVGEIPQRNIKITADRGNISPNGQRLYYIDTKIPLIYNPDSDYSFSHWQVLLNGNDVTSKGYIKFETESSEIEPGKENYDRNATAVFVTVGTGADTIPENSILQIKPVYYVRPQICSYTPTISAVGSYRDARIQIMFDMNMDDGSIYYSTDEIEALKDKGIEDIDSQAEINDRIYTEEYSFFLKNGRKYYGYADKDGRYYFKNIKISNFRNKDQSLLKYYQSPYFETPEVLVIPAKNGDNAPPRNSQIYVEISEDIYYTTPTNEQVTMGSSKKWNYYVASGTDINPPDIRDFYVQAKDTDDNYKYLRTTSLTNNPSDADLSNAFIKAGLLYIYASIYDNGSGPDKLRIYYERLDSIFSSADEKHIIPCDLNVSGTDAYFGESTTHTGDVDNEYWVVDLNDYINVNGLYRITFAATDVNGNETNCSTTDTDNDTFYIYLDNTKPSPVTGLAKTAQTQTSVTLKWTNPSEFTSPRWTGHKYYVKDLTARTPEVPATVSREDAWNTDTMAINGLVPGHKYEFRVSTFDNVLGAECSEKVTVTTYTKPNGITNLTATNTKDNPSKINFSWTNPEGDYTGVRYLVRQGAVKGTAGNWSYGPRIEKDNTEFTADVQPGLWYEYFFFSFAEDSIDDYSKAYGITKSWIKGGSIEAYASPNTVTNVSAERSSTSPDSEVVLSWTNPANYAGVKVLYGTEADPTTVWDGSITKGTTSVTITGLDCSTTYNFKVVTYVGEIPEDWTTESAESDVFKTNITATPVSCRTAPNKATGVTLVRNSTDPDTAIDVSWANPTSGVYDGVVVRYNLNTVADGTWIDIPLAKDTTSTTITGLEPGSIYKVVVTTYLDEWNSTCPQNKTTAIVCATKPNAATGLSVVRDTSDPNTKIRLSWTNPTDGDYSGNKILYNTTDAIASASVWSGAISKSDTSATITGLVPGQSYYFWLVTYAGNWSTYNSNFATSVTTASTVSGVCYTKPKGVTGITLARNSTNPGTSVDISWTNNANAARTGVKVLYGVTSSSISTTGATVTTAGATSATVTGLQPGTQYYFAVVPYSGEYSAGANTNTGIVTVCTAGNIYTTPNAVTGLTATRDATYPGSKVTLSWASSATGGYTAANVYYKLATATTYTKITTSQSYSSSTGKYSVTVTGLTAGTKYDFKVEAYAGTNTNVSSAVTANCYTRPNPVTNLSVSSMNSDNMTLTWSEPTSGSYTTHHFWVRDITAKETSFTYKTYSSSTSSYTVTELTPGHQYEFKVTTGAADSPSDSSNVSTDATVIKYTRPQVPAITSITPSGTTSLVVNWDKTYSGAMQYVNIGYSTTNDITEAIYAGWEYPNTGSLTITKLTPGTRYYIWIASVAPGESTSWADKISGAERTNVRQTSYTGYTTPNPVTDLKIVSTTPGNIKLSWKEPTEGSYTAHHFWTRDITAGEKEFTHANYTSSNSEFNLSGLVAGHQYTIKVTTSAGATTSDYTNESDGVTVTGYCRSNYPTISKISVPSTGNASSDYTSLIIEWTNPSTYVKYVDLAVSETNDLSKAVYKGWEYSKTGKATIKGLTQGKSYYIWIGCCDVVGTTWEDMVKGEASSNINPTGTLAYTGYITSFKPSSASSGIKIDWTYTPDTTVRNSNAGVAFFVSETNNVNNAKYVDYWNIKTFSTTNQTYTKSNDNTISFKKGNTYYFYYVVYEGTRPSDIAAAKSNNCYISSAYTVTY